MGRIVMLSCLAMALFALVAQAADEKPNAAATPAQNLVVNAGFEDRALSADRRPVPQRWHVRVTARSEEPNRRFQPLQWPTDNIVQMELSPQAARTGEHGLLMKQSADEPRLIAQQRIVVENARPGQWYVLSAYARSPGKGPAWAFVDIYGDKYGPTAQSYVMFLTTEWKQFKAPFQLRKHQPAPKEGEQCALWVRLVGWTPLADIHWDDVSLVAVGKPEAFPSADQPDPDWEAQSARMKKASPTVPGEIIVEPPALHALGFEWPIQGDANRNGKVEVRWRKKGEQDWRQAMPMHRTMWEWVQRVMREEDWICPNSYAGSVLDLEPATEYEVHFLLTDPDGGDTERTITASTRRPPRLPDAIRRLHVYPEKHAGEKTEPAFTGLRGAYAQAQPGDHIMVHAGVYAVSEPQDAESRLGKTAYVLDKAGTSERPIAIRGAGDGAAVFEQQDMGILFDIRGASHTWIEGLTLRGASHCVIWADDVVGLVIRRCRIEAQAHGIRISPRLWAMDYKNVYGGRDCIISDNVLIGALSEIWRERGKWLQERGGYANALKGTAVVPFGVGHEVCHNRVEGFFDGINVGTNVASPNRWGKPRGGFDVYNNLIVNCMDDGSELDGTFCNARFHHNLIDGALMAISTQPVRGGPAYIYRNVAYRNSYEPIKTHNWPAGIHAFNNTFISNTGFSKMPSMWQCSRFVNNIFFQIAPWGKDELGPFSSGTATPETCVLDYNGYRMIGKAMGWESYPAGRLNWRDVLRTTFEKPEDFVRHTGFEKNAVWGLGFGDFVKLPEFDKDWPALAEVDLRLREGSRAIDAGTVIPQITDGYAGKAPDLGAYEFGRPLPHYGPREGQ